MNTYPIHLTAGAIVDATIMLRNAARDTEQRADAADRDKRPVGARMLRERAHRMLALADELDRQLSSSLGR